MSGVWHILPFSLIIAYLLYSVAKLFHRTTWEDFSPYSSHIETLSVRNTEICGESLTFSARSLDQICQFIFTYRIFNTVLVLQLLFIFAMRHLTLYQYVGIFQTILRSRSENRTLFRLYTKHTFTTNNGTHYTHIYQHQHRCIIYKK